MKSIFLIMLVFVAGYSDTIRFWETYIDKRFEICERKLSPNSYVKCINGVVYFKEISMRGNKSIFPLYNKDGSLTQCRCD